MTVQLSFLIRCSARNSTTSCSRIGTRRCGHPVKTERTLAIPRGKYFFALNGDGTCCAFVLADINVFSNLLFPTSANDVKSPIGAAEHSGKITTKSISTFCFEYLSLPDSNPNHCCVLGFHSYDFEPGDAKNGFREKIRAEFPVDISRPVRAGIRRRHRTEPRDDGKSQ